MPTLIRQENTLLAPYEPPPVLVERAGRIGNITTLFGVIEQRDRAAPRGKSSAVERHVHPLGNRLSRNSTEARHRRLAESVSCREMSIF